MSSSEEVVTTLNIRVTPLARKNQITQILEDGTIIISIIAPPIGGKANQALIKFLAKILDISIGNIEIISGERNRNKRIKIYGLARDTAQARISNQLRGKD